MVPSDHNSYRSLPTHNSMKLKPLALAKRRVYAAATMSLTVAIAALTALAVGEILKWVITRRWSRSTVNPKTVLFPRMCPACLSENAESLVEEESSKRRTANYVVAHKLEWWNAPVPYCSRCSWKLSRGQTTGFAAGAVCVVAAFFLAPPPDASIAIFGYILYGYPVYAIATTVEKGIVLGSQNSETMSVRVKHAEYFRRLAALNAASVGAPTEVPLPEDKGVWRKRV